MKTTKRLGIIGGLGAETSCRFCLNVNNKVRKKTNRQPEIVLENLPISIATEKKLINGGVGKEHSNLLVKATQRLNHAEVDFIAIPCNTAHTFIEKLRKYSNCPILSIVEETVLECKKKGIKKIGLLSSTKTIKEKLFLQKLNKFNIGLLIPEKKRQRKIDQAIIRGH